MNHTIMKRGAASVCCAAIICAASFAGQPEESTPQKVGLVTGISYSVTDSKVTVTTALGTMKEPAESDKKVPPEQVKTEDLITFSGETVTFTLPADTPLELGMPPKDNTGSGDSLPPSPEDDRRPEMKQSPLTVKNILIGDIVTLRYDADGKTVSGVKAAMLPLRLMMRERGRERMRRPAGKDTRGSMPMDTPDDDRQGSGN